MSNKILSAHWYNDNGTRAEARHSAWKSQQSKQKRFAVRLPSGNVKIRRGKARLEKAITL